MFKLLTLKKEIKNLSKYGKVEIELNNNGFSKTYFAMVNGQKVAIVALPNDCGISRIESAGNLWNRVKFAVEAVS